MNEPTVHFASCPRGLEPILAKELQEAGVRDFGIKPGGVAFRAPRAVVYRALLGVRTAIRLQELMARGRVTSPQELYELARSVPWEAGLDPDATFAVEASLRDSVFNHPGATALTVKDAVADRFRAGTGRRPDVRKDDPDLRIHAVILRDEARIYRDLSGESLHKRGYRPELVKSPLNEALAAGLVLLAELPETGVVADPMCGSGTLLIEAALIAGRRAPNLHRRFACERWRDADRPLLAHLRQEAASRERAIEPGRFVGADIHSGAIVLAERAAKAAGVADAIRFEAADALDFDPKSPLAAVVTNPPWGPRLESDTAPLEDAWKALGRFLHLRARGAVAHVLSGDPELTRFLGLRASRRHPVKNGPIECRWLRYEIDATPPERRDRGAPRNDPGP